MIKYVYNMLFFGALTILLATAQAKFWTDCGSKLATVQTVSVSGCSDDAEECTLRRKSNTTISIGFTPSDEVKSLMTVVRGTFMSIFVPFPIAQPDACEENISCPLPANQMVKYEKTIPVLKVYPKVGVDIKWELQNEDGANVVCVMIHAKIV